MHLVACIKLIKIRSSCEKADLPPYALNVQLNTDVESFLFKYCLADCLKCSHLTRFLGKKYVYYLLFKSQ